MTFLQISQIQGRTPVTVFEVSGRINLGNYKELEAAAQQAYENGMRNLVLDISGVDSLTSIGIRTLIVIHKLLNRDKAGMLKLAGVVPPVRDMFDIAGVSQFLEIHDTTAEAVAAF